MKRVILALSAALLFLLSACGGASLPGIDVYRLHKLPDSSLSYALVAENVTIEPGIDPVSFIIGTINSEPAQSDIVKPLPDGIYISDFEKHGKTLKLKLSDGFSDIRGPRRALAEAALIMTFTDFADIEFVSIEEGGRVIMRPRGVNSVLFEDTSLIIEK